MRTFAIVVALSALCWPGVATAEGDDDCVETDDCTRYGRCETYDDEVSNKLSCEVPEGGCATAGPCTGKGLCVTGLHPVDNRPICQVDATSCAWSNECRFSGRCATGIRAGAGACVVETTAQCEASPACARFGRCALGRDLETMDAMCVPTAAGCATSGACTVDGHCGWDEALKGCVAVSEAACLASTGCKQLGDCALVGRRCAPNKASHCTTSRECKEAGVCDFNVEDNYCGRSDAGCAATTACHRYGRCKVLSGRDEDWCSGEEDEACAATVACKRYGACHIGASWSMNTHCRILQIEDGDMLPDLPLAIARVVVPSTQLPFKGYTFDATNLLDGKADTSWQPRGAKRGGVGVVLKVELESAAQVCGVIIKNGFQRKDDLGDMFSANGRIEFARIKVGPRTRELLTFGPDDKYGTVYLPPAAATKTVTIEVLSVHPGTRWKDLAISEIQVFGCDPLADTSE